MKPNASDDRSVAIVPGVGFRTRKKHHASVVALMEANVSGVRFVSITHKSGAGFPACPNPGKAANPPHIDGGLQDS